MYNVYDTLFSHKASFSQGRYLHHLFPSLDINLLLNAIEKCSRMYMNFLTAVYTEICNEYIWWKIIFRTKFDSHLFFKRCPSLIRACKAVCALKDCDTLLFHDILAWFWIDCFTLLLARHLADFSCYIAKPLGTWNRLGFEPCGWKLYRFPIDAETRWPTFCRRHF